MSVFNSQAHCISIEKTLLSSLLFDYSLMDLVVDKLREDMFYLPLHGKFYKAIEELYKEELPIDEDFLRKKLDDKVTDEDILQIMQATPITKINSYCDEIIEKYTKRELLKVRNLITKFDEDENIKSIESIESIRLRLDEIENLTKNSDDDVLTLGEWDEIYSKEPDLDLLPTNIKWIDNTLVDEDGKTKKKGIQLGNFVFLSGKKETGKTYLGTTIIENMAMNGVKTGFFSMEFGTKHYRNSIKKKYKHKDNLKREAIFKNVIVEHRVNDIAKIEKKINKMVKKGVKCIFLDSQLRIQNQKMDKATKAEKLADAFQRLGILCQKHEIIIIMVVQTSKADHDADEVSVKGCIDADHEASLWIHIKKEKKSELRDMLFAKNKQNYKRPVVKTKFNPFTHDFKQVQFETEDGVKIVYEEPDVSIYEETSKNSQEEPNLLNTQKQKQSTYEPDASLLNADDLTNII